MAKKRVPERPQTEKSDLMGGILIGLIAVIAVFALGVGGYAIFRRTTASSVVENDGDQIAEPSPPEVVPPPTEAPLTVPMTSQPINLLALIDPERHYIHGTWSQRGKDIVSPTTVEAAMLELPFQATPSYEMNLEVERVSTKVECFCISFPIGGQQTMVVFDGYDGKLTGLNLVNGQKAIFNPDSYRKPVIMPGKNQIKLTVTPGTIVTEVNGQQVVNWKGDPKTLSLEYYWKAGAGKAFMGTWNAEYVVSRIEVRSL